MASVQATSLLGSDDFSRVRGDKLITFSVCRHCLRVVAFAASADVLKIAEAAHLQRCRGRVESAGLRGPGGPMVWDNSFRVNIASVDSQHSRLVSMVNVLSESVARGEGERVLTLLMNALLAYTEAHFRDEEGLMAKHAYPGLAAHKAEHEALTAAVLRFRREFATEGQDVSERLLEFLRKWLSNHILGTDRQYGAFLREHGEK